MTDFLLGEPLAAASESDSFRDMAREEFWIVAKTFFAPIYVTVLVLRHLLKVTKRVDTPVISKGPHKRNQSKSGMPRTEAQRLRPTAS